MGICWAQTLGWLTGRGGLVGFWKSVIWGPFYIFPLWIPTSHGKDSDTVCLSGTLFVIDYNVSSDVTLPSTRELIRALAYSFPQLSLLLPVRTFLPSLALQPKRSCRFSTICLPLFDSLRPYFVSIFPNVYSAGYMSQSLVNTCQMKKDVQVSPLL